MSKIVIEGIDGSGKGTLIKGLRKTLAAHGVKAIFRSEPTDKGRKQLMAAADRGTLKEDAEAIFLKDRTEHLQKLGPYFEAGKPVIIDRHILSTIAYQGTKGKVEEIALTQLQNFAPADLTILLDLPVDTALARIHVREKAGKQNSDAADKEFEKKANLERTRRLYHRFLGLAGVQSVVIDATRPPEAVLSIATGAILTLLGKSEQKMPQSIFCVPREALVKAGLILPSDTNPKTNKCRLLDPKTLKRTMQRVLAEGLWVERVLAEENTNYKQIIPSMLVEDPDGKFLYYTRQGNEKRLHKQVALTLGGHIDPEDVAGADFFRHGDGGSFWNMVLTGAARELREEFGPAAIHCEPLQVLGIINDDSNEVGSVHLGILMATRCRLAVHHRNNPETGLMRTETAAKLRKNPNLETWSKAILTTLSTKKTKG